MPELRIKGKIHDTELCIVNRNIRLSFRRSLVSGLPSPRSEFGWRSAGSFPEQQLVIELIETSVKNL